MWCSSRYGWSIIIISSRHYKTKDANINYYWNKLHKPKNYIYNDLQVGYFYLVKIRLSMVFIRPIILILWLSTFFFLNITKLNFIYHKVFVILMSKLLTVCKLFTYPYQNMDTNFNIIKHNFLSSVYSGATRRGLRGCNPSWKVRLVK